ncbi:nuclear transport factor 2 family protein [Salegentibacter chungangensis]|uniref:Nuclear transport factor 2 family protein n=1 Tax=Salegentibacter chungangensis TaxID=1335724 RepID=A0ABW3NUV7_9FLAO
MGTTEKFLREINEAFAKGNSDFITEHVTDNIVWNVVGDCRIKGKKNFRKVLDEMDVPENMQLDISNILVQERTAVVDGYIEVGKKGMKLRRYAFCDIYKLSALKEPRIEELVSYVIEIKI